MRLCSGGAAGRSGMVGDEALSVSMAVEHDGRRREARPAERASDKSD